MRLLSLDCDQKSFKTLNFNPNGLSIIIGDRLRDHHDTGSSNGVGKTLALRLVHHCLGAKRDTGLRNAVPDWNFSLYFELDGHTHNITRNGYGNKITLDQRETNLKQLHQWLNENGGFHLNESLSHLSFRSLIKRFARVDIQDCTSPIQTYKEHPFEALLRSLYLLGTDINLVYSKHNIKKELDQIESLKKDWQKDKILSDVLRTGDEPRPRLDWLNKEISSLEKDLHNFEIAEDYRKIESDANQITQQIRELERKKNILTYQINSIDKSLEEHPDINREELLELYSGLQRLFKEDALQHFSNVESFHFSLVENRKARLNEEKINLYSQIDDINKSLTDKSEYRDHLLQYLNDKRALDEYTNLSQRLVSLREERDRLTEYIHISSRLDESKQKLREQLVEEDRRAYEYARAGPLAKADEIYRQLVSKMYPEHPAGLLLESNDRNNQIRYNLKVHVQGQDSDGINAARILAFDWLLFSLRYNHNINFLWHDNRFFSDIDPNPRASWFSHIINSDSLSSNQYIATINTENYESLLQHVNERDSQYINNSVICTLRGGEPENKLLGIQF